MLSEIMYAVFAHTLKALRIGGASNMDNRNEVVNYVPKRRGSNSYVDSFAGLLFSKPYSTEFIAAVMDAADYVGPINYELDIGDREEFVYYSTGCQGDSVDWGTDPQKEVADQLRADIKRLPPNERPVFINFTGDNISSPSSFYDNVFKKYFYNHYCKEEFSDIPCLMTSGNHDENIDKQSYYLSSTSGYEVALHSVAQTYTDTDGRVSSVLALREMFETPKLKLSRLAQIYNRHFIEPHVFYGVYWKKLQIFFVNSNSIVKDFLLFCNLDPSDPNYRRNQFAFINEEYKKAIQADRTIIFSQHHPLRSSGKRVRYGDAHFYFRDVKDGLEVFSKVIKSIEILESFDITPREIYHVIFAIVKQIYVNSSNLSRRNTIIKEVLYAYLASHNKVDISEIDGAINQKIDNAPMIYNYGLMLTKLYMLAGWQTDLIDVSHDHFANFFNNAEDPKETFKICQTTYGGSSLQSHEYFAEHMHVGYHNKRLGYKQIRWNPNNPKQLTITFRAIGEPEVTFTNQSKHPVRKKCCDEIEAVRTMILQVADDYFAYLNRESLHGNKAAITMASHLDGIINYLNQDQLPDIHHLIDELYHRIEVIPVDLQVQDLKQLLLDALTNLIPDLEVKRKEEHSSLPSFTSLFRVSSPETSTSAKIKYSLGL